MTQEKESQHAYIQRVLNEVATKYHIPDSLIPQLISLLEKYPTLEIRGAKGDLENDLEQIFTTLQAEGVLRTL